MSDVAQLQPWQIILDHSPWASNSLQQANKTSLLCSLPLRKVIKLVPSAPELASFPENGEAALPPNSEPLIMLDREHHSTQKPIYTTTDKHLYQESSAALTLEKGSSHRHGTNS